MDKRWMLEPRSSSRDNFFCASCNSWVGAFTTAYRQYASKCCQSLNISPGDAVLVLEGALEPNPNVNHELLVLQNACYRFRWQRRFAAHSTCGEKRSLGN